MNIGDYIKVWHNTVAFGVEPFYARVIKVNRVTVQVRTENGEVSKVTKQFAGEHLLSEGEWHPDIAKTPHRPDRYGYPANRRAA